MSSANLAEVSALSEMDGGNFIRLHEYAARPPNLDSTGKVAERDPRVVVAQMVVAGVPVRSEHPVTIGIYKGLRLLIDGYARSLLFLYSAKEIDRMMVFVPVA
jgi:hypothetical protein